MATEPGPAGPGEEGLAHPEGSAAGDLPCAARSHADDEALLGTASTVRRWILVEQPGPWGPTAPHDSRMEPELAGALALQAQAVGARLLLIRRPGGAPATERRRAFVAVSDSRGGWAESLDVPTPEALTDVDFAPLRRRRSVGGDPVRTALLLVCTNGAHDRCCATEGQPLVRALTAAHPESVWEASHVGGCRFSGNLVCLPEGIYYGRLDADSGLAAAQAHLAGRIHRPAFRGRSGIAMPAQAAEAMVRDRFGLDDLDAVRAHTHRTLEHEVHEVGLTLHDGREVTARVAVHRDREPRALTCSADELLRPPRYELLAMSAIE